MKLGFCMLQMFIKRRSSIRIILLFLFISYTKIFLFYCYSKHKEKMGCCISHDKDQVNTIEVVLDENGVARRVAAGQGTHLIKIFPDKETKMERKPPTKPSEMSHLSRPQAAYYPKKPPMSCFPTSANRQKIHPNNDIVAKEEQLDANEKA
ncbi:hypothetical protein PS15p_202394 [Mucor circinelloides]